jgi:hypothetical protein
MQGDCKVAFSGGMGRGFAAPEEKVVFRFFAAEPQKK